MHKLLGHLSLQLFASQSIKGYILSFHVTGYVLMVIFIVLLPSGVLSASLAASKNQKYWIWLIAGLVFGPIGLIASSYAKDNSSRANSIGQ